MIKREKASHSIVLLCQALGVSSSGYYAWRTRGSSPRTQEDAALTARIRTIYHQSRQTYGAPRMYAALREAGVPCSRKRVARLMRHAGVVGCHRRRHVVTTQREPTAPIAPDRVERQFVAAAPDRLWCADITAVPTHEGFLYLAVVLDAYSRRIVGWSMAAHVRTALVLDAVDMALGRRRPAPDVIHHSDHGCQYTSLAFGVHCAAVGIQRSMGTVGDCYDNAITESFFATLECELLARQTFRSHAQARTALFDYIEGFYNTQRLHSALGYQSPSAFERQKDRHAAA